MRRPYTMATLFAGITAVFTLAACGGSDSATSPKNLDSFKSLSPAEQAALDSSVVIEVESSVQNIVNADFSSGFTDPFVGFGFQRTLPRRTATLAHILGRSIPSKVSLQLHAKQSTPTDCPSTTPANPTYNSLGIPTDTIVIAFGSDCVSGSLTETGSISVWDPVPNSPGLNFEEVFKNFGISIKESADTSIALGINGSIGVSNTPGIIAESDTASWGFGIHEGSTADTIGITEKFAATYTYTGDVITEAFSVPNGSLSLNGSWNYFISVPQANNQLESGNIAFTVSTPTPLVIDNTCTTNIGSVVSGTLVIKFSDGTTVTAVWSGCPASPSLTTT